MALSRRRFLVGCSAAIAATAGARLAAFVGGASTGDTSTLLVLVALRGGWDGLSVLSPLDGIDRHYYEAARPILKIPAAGQGAAIRLTDQFGLHPAMGALVELFQSRKIAFVHAVGLTVDTRSHFDAMEFIELGTPGSKTIGSGWVTRHLISMGTTSVVPPLPLVAMGTPPTSMLGSPETVALTSVDEFTIGGESAQRRIQEQALRSLYRGPGWLEQAGTHTLDAASLIEQNGGRDYVPANGAIYPENDTGNAFKTLAQLVKLEVGVQIASIDVGGWDTHDNQAEGSSGYLAGPLTGLARSLHAFYLDLDGAGYNNRTDHLVVVLQSEFGRRLAENASRGTDHGHGSVMAVLGGRVNGGQIFGTWPGLARNQLFEGEDLAVTTDYRSVLGEILVKRLGNPRISDVFPGFDTYRPLGIV